MSTHPKETRSTQNPGCSFCDADPENHSGMVCIRDCRDFHRHLRASELHKDSVNHLRIINITALW